MALRPIRLDDAPVLAELRARSAEHLAPWEPDGLDDLMTVEGQEQSIAARLAERDAGQRLPFVIVDDDRVVGQLTINDIVRGPFQSGHLGYWLSVDATGRGLATRAVHEALREVFVVEGLHRVQAGTLLHNRASQAVLRRNGFVAFGVAPRYLRIAGEWQDHVLFQRLADD